MLQLYLTLDCKPGNEVDSWDRFSSQMNNRLSFASVTLNTPPESQRVRVVIMKGHPEVPPGPTFHPPLQLCSDEELPKPEEPSVPIIGKPERIWIQLVGEKVASFTDTEADHTKSKVREGNEHPTKS